MTAAEQSHQAMRSLQQIEDGIRDGHVLADQSNSHEVLQAYLSQLAMAAQHMQFLAQAVAARKDRIEELIAARSAEKGAGHEG